MDDSVGVDIGVAIEDLVHKGHCFWFGNDLFVGDELGEITAFAEFGDDVGIILGVVDVIEFDDVL